MTQTQTHRSPLAKQRLYRRLMVGFVIAGTVLGVALRELLNYPLVGEVVYWGGIVAFLAVWRGSSVTLFDERDKALERRASHLTITLFAVVLVLGASAARIATYTDLYTFPAGFWTVLWGYVAVFVTYAVVYGWLRYVR
ncbi:DUF2178 domain-containing protein [Haladaptatus sp. GCM10025707]|uniref:DUF2178 domain-containing protein n=1 Tax=unclassified Haladaptatus TaxID=2622732 RepID=UPI0023E8B585|nr:MULTISPECIES: DUF2178 domain-containing protein [unclassified Haladaptatus]